MKYATSVKYGGEIINAEECDYDSFHDLVPLCPICKEAVHLRKGSSLITHRDGKKLKKSYQITPHWSHGPGASKESVAGCELRVSKLTKKEINRLNNRARRQRLKLLHKKFWKILEQQCYPLTSHYSKIDRFRYEDPCFDALMLGVLDHSYRDFINSVKAEQLRQSPTLEERIHLEVLEFLAAPKQKYTVNKIIKCVVSQVYTLSSKRVRDCGLQLSSDVINRKIEGRFDTEGVLTHVTAFISLYGNPDIDGIKHRTPATLVRFLLDGVHWRDALYREDDFRYEYSKNFSVLFSAMLACLTPDLGCIDWGYDYRRLELQDYLADISWKVDDLYTLLGVAWFTPPVLERIRFK